jgi:hypothetical protein
VHCATNHGASNANLEEDKHLSDDDKKAKMRRKKVLDVNNTSLIIAESIFARRI